MSYYEFTGETTTASNMSVLHQIRATRALPQHGVAVGDLGGWVEWEFNLSGSAWVSGNAQVFDNARVSDSARVSGSAQVSGSARVFGNAQVFGSAWVFGNAQVFGSAQVFGKAWVSGDAWVSGNAQVFGDAQVFGKAWVSGSAWVSEPQHVITVTPVGSESVTATAHRTESGHELHIGCWTGTVDHMAAEVARRAQHWRCDEATAARWRAEYAALATLVRARITGWSDE